ncbi:MAG TPA: hypothetical protein EYQ31_15250, partial [Candidatus Handelsmanbacteria bacterium]|nr:hypothetical protein [Candidatus Handelsmanbacteria bacterium]
MPKELTDRQQEIFDFIATIIRSRGAPPTIREIMDEFDINSTNGVRTTLAALEKKGHIRRHPRLSRGIELVDASFAGPGPGPITSGFVQDPSIIPHPKRTARVIRGYSLLFKPAITIA